MTLIWIMMVFSTLVVVDSPPAGDGHSYYWNKKWIDCPLTCETCTSNTTCTLCKTKYYGPACQLECHCNDDGCNKVTGVCAPGCVDGRWGKYCELQCPDCVCKKCDNDSGQCLHCHDNYFLHDGKCKICPHGCSLCVNDSKCIECQESYFLLDGRCESCMQGCQLCNTSNNCILCNNESVALFHDLCLVRCPANTTITTKLDISTNLPDSHHNISTCEKHTYSYIYTESGFCQTQSSDFPFVEFKCIYHCNKSYDSISCERTCIVHERKQQHDISRNQGCADGQYGTDCEFQCPGCGRCKKCDRNTGQCLQCYDNYFLHDGKCKICPRGCSLCVNDSKCTECQESYFLLDGRCESCMQGCRLCNTSNNCILCNNESITLFDGSCLVRCPANTTITTKLDISTNLPGTHDNISTCEEHSYSYNYTESGFCQTQSKDLTVLEFKCIYHCNKSYDSISCERTFIVHERKQQHDISWNQDKNASNVTNESKETEWRAAFLALVACIVIIGIPILIYCIWLKRRIPNKVNLPRQVSNEVLPRQVSNEVLPRQVSNEVLPRQVSNEEMGEIPPSPSMPIPCVDNFPKPVQEQTDVIDEDSDSDSDQFQVDERDPLDPSDDPSDDPSADDSDTDEKHNRYSSVQMCDE